MTAATGNAPTRFAFEILRGKECLERAFNERNES
jgi:hypothetical protein